MALAILALSAVFLLDRRVTIVRDATRHRDARLLWVLASQKMAELELDPALWLPDAGSETMEGDFSHVHEDYAGFVWQAEKERVEVPIPGRPEELALDESKRKELFRLVLRVFPPDGARPFEMQALFPIATPEPALTGTEGAEGGGTGTTPPRAGGNR